MICTERVTWLESFAWCPYKYKNVPFDTSDPQTIMNTSIWDIAHIAHQYPQMAHILCDQFFDDVVPEVLWSRDNIKKEQTHNIINLAKDWIEEFKDNEKYFEVKTRMMIWWVMVTWSYDCLVVEKDWSFHLFDYKTAASLSAYSNWNEKLQVMIYAYFIMKKFDVDRIKVSYQIYVKWKNNTKARAVRKTKTFYARWIEWSWDEYIWNIFGIVEKVCKRFKLATEMDTFYPNNRNEDWSFLSTCFYCPIRDWKSADKAWLKICPLKWWMATLNTEEEIDF